MEHNIVNGIPGARRLRSSCQSRQPIIPLSQACSNLILLLIGLIALQVATPSLALNPSRPLSQLRLTGWNVAEGAPGNIKAISQGRDGFLWLGTANGLYRFDGVSFEHVAPADREPARSLQVTALLTARNGDLWVGYDYGGVGVVRAGTLKAVNPWPPRGSVLQIVETADDAIWILAESGETPVLTRFLDGLWSRVDESWGLPMEHPQSILATRDGSLYIALYNSIVRLPAGARRFERVPGHTVLGSALAQQPSGALWLSDDDGLRPLGRSGRNMPLPHLNQAFVNRSLIFDREGSLWIAGQEAGLARMPPAAFLENATHPAVSALEVLPSAGSLQFGRQLTVYEDREGNIWSGGPKGLTRLASHSLMLLPFSKQLLTGLVRNTKSGDLYFGAGTGIFKIAGPDQIPQQVMRLGNFASGLCGDRNGNLMALANTTATIWSETSVRTIPNLDRPTNSGAVTCAADDAGTWWLETDHLFRVDGSRIVPAPGPAGGVQGDAMMLRSDGSGGLLSYLPFKALSRIVAGKVTPLWAGRDIPIGFIKTIQPGRDSVLIGGEQGLARYDGHQFAALDVGRYPFLANVTGVVQTEHGETWIIGSDGIARMRTEDLGNAFAHPGAPLPYKSYGRDQGLRARSDVYDTADAAEDAAGRIWFASNQGLAWLDPRHLYTTVMPPIVAIQRMSANGRDTPISSSTVRLAPSTTRIELDYTALGLSDAVANHFLYRLEGVDRSWIDAGRTRTAYYTNLKPGSYRFKVIAANADGIWNREGASLEIIVPPAFWQTKWFGALLLLLLLCIIGFVVRARTQAITLRTQSRIEAQTSERERIARELHDTLLQGVQGLMLHVQAAVDGLGSETPARKMLENALERGDDVLLEGRQRVRDLRMTQRPRALETRLESLANGEAELIVLGKRREVCGPIVDEVAAIVGEALANARRHAGASIVVVTIDYRPRAVEVTIRDDGIGIDPTYVEAGQRDGHFGLLGMRERAARMGGRLTISATPTDGTTIVLRLPGAIAYRPRRWFWRS